MSRPFNFPNFQPFTLLVVGIIRRDCVIDGLQVAGDGGIPERCADLAFEFLDNMMRVTQAQIAR